MTAASSTRVRPAATSTPMADASAHCPCGYAEFSTFAPAWIEPSSARSAAPTRKREYGACARSITSRAAATSASAPSSRSE
jgi:hypothetical protein